MLVAVGLVALARWQRDVALTTAAAQRIALVQSGGSPYAWRFQEARDLIAGRVFGSAQFALGTDGLRLTLPPQGVEIGLPLAGERIDLARYDRLQVGLDSAAPVELRVVVRQRLDGEQIDALVPGIRPGAPQRFAFADLLWRDAAGTSVSPPTHAAALRLRLRATSAIALRLHDVAVVPSAALQAPGLLARSRAGARDAEAARARADADTARLPLLTFATAESNEAVLALRDRATAQEPAALLLPQDRLADLAPVPASNSSRPALAWLGLALLAGALVAVRLRPPASSWRRAALELAVLLLPLGFLVLDGRIGDDLGLPLGLAGALLFLYAASLPRLAPWHWFGGLRSGALPLFTVALALGLALRYGDHLALRGPGMVLRYLAWAALQQFLLCTVIADRLRRLMPSAAWTALAAGALFGLLHAPNESLMLATFLGGLLWTAAWLRHRRLLPLIVAHALGALLLFATLPPTLLRSAEVSARFFSF